MVTTPISLTHCLVVLPLVPDCLVPQGLAPQAILHLAPVRQGLEGICQWALFSEGMYHVLLFEFNIKYSMFKHLCVACTKTFICHIKYLPKGGYCEKCHFTKTKQNDNKKQKFGSLMRTSTQINIIVDTITGVFFTSRKCQLVLH